MPKATEHPTRFDNLSAGELADAIGALKAEAAELAAREAALKTELIGRHVAAAEGALFRAAIQLQQTASDLTNWICSLVPETLAEAIMLLDWHGKQGGVEDDVPVNVLAGLRAITEGDPAASLLAPNVSRDDEILRLFREWRALWRATSIAASDDDNEVARAGDKLTALERRIFDAPAGDARGLAVKAFMVAHLDCSDRADDGEPRIDGFSPEYHYGAENMLTLDKHAIRGLVESLIEFLPEVRPLCAAVLASPVKFSGEQTTG